MDIYDDDDDDLNEDAREALFAPDLDNDQAPTAYASGKALAQARPTSNNQMTMLRDEARKLAMLKGKEPSVMDAVMAGIAAKTGRASTDPAAAFLDGFVTSGVAAWQGGKAKDDTDARHKRIISQLTEERKAENDGRRTRAYEQRAARGGSTGRPSRPLNPLQAERWIEQTIKDRYAGDIERLNADATAVPAKRMKPEERQGIIDNLNKERDRLRSLNAGPQQGSPPAGDAANTQAPPRKRSTTPGPPPQAVPRHAPGPQSARSALPKGWTRERAVAATQKALAKAGNDPVARAKVMDTATSMGLL